MAQTARNPKYVRIASKLEEKIHSGILAHGERLPTERELCGQFGVASQTLRHALQLLSDQGLISREQGRGTFVSSPSPHAPKGKAGIQPVALIGFGPSVSGWRDPANWEVHMRCYQGMVEAGFDCGFAIRSLDLPSGKRTLDDYLGVAANSSGILIHADSDHPPPATMLAALRETGTPVVAIERHQYSVCSEARVDLRAGGRLAMEHLIGLGHRRIGLLTGKKNIWIEQREIAYADALEAAGIERLPELIAADPVGLPDDAAKVAHRMLSMAAPPTAIFAVNDLRALGVVAAASELGLRIPEDISVIGFDDIAPAGIAHPPLTTIRNPVYELGREAVFLLKALIASPTSDLRIRSLVPTLVIRESCGPV